MSGSEIVQKILEIRGVPAADRDSFLHPSLSGLADPAELDGIAGAADAVLEAVAAGKRIVVFGDYDCDGISATAILVRTLRALGANVGAFLPDRLKEGYGMSDASVARMLSENPGVGLVVTVDNGVGSIAQVAALKSKGVSVVVTDHHLPTVDSNGNVELPDADALVNPKVASPEGLSDLCGAGVAFLLANRIISEARSKGLYRGPNVGGPMLVLSGLATVTDIMPLLGQNRIIVAEALKRFSVYAPVGLKELHGRAARTGADCLTARDFGFMMGPRINAAGRMSSGMEALELLLSDDREISRSLARIVDMYNTDRKQVEHRMTEEALSKVVEGAEAQVIELPDGHPGVVGIVAARVLEKIGGTTPVCVIAAGHGSARSPEGINLRDAFAACSEALETFGGHAVAGGFVVKPGAVDEFRRLLCRYCREAADSSGRKIRPDAEPELWLEEGDLTLELAEAVSMLEPFGEGNGDPVFGLRGVFFSEVRTMGIDGRHLSLVLKAGGIRAILWNRGDLAEEFRSKSHCPCDLFFTVTISDYGVRHVELRLVGYRRENQVR